MILTLDETKAKLKVTSLELYRLEKELERVTARAKNQRRELRRINRTNELLTYKVKLFESQKLIAEFEKEKEFISL